MVVLYTLYLIFLYVKRIEEEFLRALDGGRLVLAIILAPWCDKSKSHVIYDAAVTAVRWLETNHLALSSPESTLPPSISKPLIGLMDISEVATEELIESFGTVTHYPALKFVLTFPDGNERKDDGVDEEEKEEDGQVQIWDFIGPRETAGNIYDSVLMYWYRFVVSNALDSGIVPTPTDGLGNTNGNNGEPTPPIFTFSSQDRLTTFLDSHGERLLRPAQARRRDQGKLDSEMFNFYMGQMERNDVGGVFHPYEFPDEDSRANRQCSTSNNNDDGENGANKEDCDKHEEYTQEIDPYILLVQCRWKKRDYGKMEQGITVGEISRLEGQRRAMNDFDDLAEEMSHRMDVAFFALNATIYDEETTSDLSEKECDGLFDGIEGDPNGAVAFLRARRYVTYSINDEPAKGHLDEKQNHNIWSHRAIRSVRTDWDEVKRLKPHAAFVPGITIEEMPEEVKQIHGKNAVKDPLIPIQYVTSNLVASTIVHATPTVIWFDKDRMAQLAFPWYRKVHAVLFVDMGLAYKAVRPNKSSHPIWPSSLNHSTETAQLLINQRKAIEMFYNAALRHRVERPADDVVFLIVPSSEVRIMTSFGIDLWTHIDEALFGTAYKEREVEELDQSSSADDNGYCSTPDNAESQSILPVMMITDSSGRSGMQSSRYYLCSRDIFASSRIVFNDGGAMGEFIDQFFSDTIGKPFIRSDTPLSTPGTASGQGKPRNSKKANVTMVTGNTFESLVMDHNDEHHMLLMQASSCGHCKRFSIHWNELSHLVQAMNWSSVVNVMKIDVSKNDVPHDKINAWDLPSVYYFPAFEKDDPIEMTPLKDRTNPQNDYDEGLSWVTSGYDLVKWMVNQGKLDLELLLRLDGSSKNDEDTSEKKDEEVIDEQ